MMSDVQVFVMPNKDRLEVYADGRVIHVGQDSSEAYPTETDISGTKLGSVLRSVLLEAASNEFPLNAGPLNLSTQVLNNESELSVSDSDKTILRQEVRQTLLSAGIPPEEVEFFGTVNVYVKILNDTRNPVKTAQTFRAKDSYPERFAAWSRRRQKDQRDSAAPGPHRKTPFAWNEADRRYPCKQCGKPNAVEESGRLCLGCVMAIDD